MIRQKIRYWIWRFLKAPSYVKRFGVWRAIGRTIELLQTSGPQNVLRDTKWRKMRRRHRYLHEHGLDALASGSWVGLEKFGVLAVRGAISDETRKRQEAFSSCSATKFSIVVLLRNTPPHFLGEMLFSVKEQTYGAWELCLVDDSDEQHDVVGKIVEFFGDADPRVRYCKLDQSQGAAMSGSGDVALGMATGDYVVLCGQGDVLHPSALFYVADAIAKRGADFIYTDECTFETENGYAQRDIYFKPNFAPDTLRGNNYIRHLTVFKRTLLDLVGGGWHHACGGGGGHDLILRLTEKATCVVHVPKVLYFCRVSVHDVVIGSGATSEGVAAVQASLDRTGLFGKVESVKGFPSFYRIRYDIVRPGRVSIVIPTKNHVRDLRKCMTSIFGRSTWSDYEIIVVDNGSSEPDLDEYYEMLKSEHDNVRVLSYDQPFNYAKINNFAVQHATGEYLLFLNNDTEVITPKWIEEMLMYAQRPDVGVVGAKLYYADGTIQHAGVGVGLDGGAAHVLHRAPGYSSGYMGRAIIACNYSAVTAACIMVRAHVFREVGGFDESFAVSMNDVDLCLRILSKGYWNVWTPHAELYHYESTSRGYEDTSEKKARFKNELTRFISRWKDFLEEGDPAYNPNLNLFGTYFSERQRDSVW